MSLLTVIVRSMAEFSCHIAGWSFDLRRFHVYIKPNFMNIRSEFSDLLSLSVKMSFSFFLFTFSFFFFYKYAVPLTDTELKTHVHDKLLR